MFRYETHCHTAPVSHCAKASAEDTVRFYRRAGYDGIFITNHFLDGNINPAVRSLAYPEQIDYYFSDYEAAAEIGMRVGIKVFPGVELSYKGTDFLIYGPEKEWYREHPEILGMKKSEELPYLMEAGALVIQAHPYREAHYIDHIRLFSRSVHGVEVINSSQPREANALTAHYAEQYGLLQICGSDNHWGSSVFSKLREKGYRPEIAGMVSDTEINSVRDFIGQVRNGTMRMFLMDEEGKVTEPVNP
jgi:predicted metal-dependent phosphoesterase TrpH